MRKLTGREKLVSVLVAILAVAAAWCVPWGGRPRVVAKRWTPSVVVETAHYQILSTATEEQTREIGRVAEIVYSGYRQMTEGWHGTFSPHAKLGIKLFKDRTEFRQCNGVQNWMEAFYQPPYCYQYYSANEVHPHHWMMHEATHQLNDAVAHLRLPQWLDEGLACYVCTSRIVGDTLHLGEIDTNTYPAWWLDSLNLSGDLDADKKKGTIIPLRAIVSGQGGPSMDRNFNRYYLHWWSLTHFLVHYENGRYKQGLSRLIADGGGLTAFEKHLGPVETVERQWYAYFVELRRKLGR